MSDSSRTPGEVVFKKYLNYQNIPFEFQKTTYRQKQTTRLHDQMGRRESSRPRREGLPAREEISRPASDKFEPYPADPEEDCCRDERSSRNSRSIAAVWCFITQGGFTFVLDSADIMLGAMYGDAGFTFPFKQPLRAWGMPVNSRRAFLGRKARQFNRIGSQGTENTTISAIITVMSIQPFRMELMDMMLDNPSIDIEAEEMRQTIPNFDPDLEVPRVIVWYNGVARIPFPTNLFRGDFDSHYGIVSSGKYGMFEQGVTYEGSAVPDRLKLSKPRKSRLV